MISVENNNGRSIAAIPSEMKEELKEFAQTRVDIVKTELREKVSRLKIAAPLATAGALFLSTAYLLITLALVALVAVFIGDTSYRWVFVFLAVAFLWLIIGGATLYVAKREFDVMPRKTIQALKGDKIWLQQEARHQL
jgi:uncharacterized membrane protein YqjE